MMGNGRENIQITIKTPIYPTEDEEKVRACILNLIADTPVEVEGDYLVARSTKMHDLYPIQNRLRQQRIRDSARKLLRRRLMPNSLEFHLNKQAAFTNRVHFVTNRDQEDPLGPITIEIQAAEEEINKVIDWITMVDFEAD
jgi:predicted RNA binding protein with dsRBD fold (UPF0201 family)